MDLQDTATTGETYFKWVKCPPCGGTGFPPRVYRTVGYRCCPHCAGVGRVEYRRGPGDTWVRKAPDLPELVAQPNEVAGRLDVLIFRVLPVLFILAFAAWAIIRSST